jgi:small-conductance mechanosensitive channel
MKTIAACLGAALTCLLVSLTGASPVLGEDAPLTIVVKPGHSAADIQQVLDLATRSGRPVAIELGDDATPVTAGAKIDTPTVQPSSASIIPVAAVTPPSSQPSAAPSSQGSTPTPPSADVPTPQATASSPAPMTPTPEMMATDMGLAKWAQFSAAFRRGADTALAGVGSLPVAIDMAKDRLTQENGGYRRVLLAAAMVIGCAALATLVLHKLTALLLTAGPATSSRFTGTIALSLKRMVADLVSIAFFVAVAHLILMAIAPQGPAAAQIVGEAVTAVTFALLYTALARLLFKVNPDGRSLVPIQSPHWHFRLLVSYGIISAVIAGMARLAGSLGVDRLIVDGWFLTGNTLLTLLKLYWFIGGRNEIRAAFISHSPGIVRRAVGNLLPEFYVATALALWLICVLFAGTPNSARWIFAAGSTQIALLALPILALGAHALIDDIARHHQTKHGAGLATALLASLRVICAGAVWVGGLHIIASIWSPFMGGDTSIAADWAFWMEKLSIAVVGCWAVASLIWNYSEAIAPSPAIMLPGHEDQNEKHQTSRLSTAMPVVRNLALGAVLAVGSLVVLSALGVNVAPLLAGFGVLGLALSFGSQALVKDIVSGIFFIAEDAFRIGEYISTGHQQGTVEQIAIRSVRLRHHNGPIHTVPFGQINSVSNYSRDWGTIKFQLKFERDSDPELIRKTAKKVGIAMLDDPEFGSDFLVPLKMQGIQDVTENSIIVRFKFTSLPGNPSIIKREAIKRLISACKAAGLEFASNAVTVRSNGNNSADAEAAAASSSPPPLAQVAV